MLFLPWTGNDKKVKKSLSKTQFIKSRVRPAFFDSRLNQDNPPFVKQEAPFAN
jgi:hypothetical protein